jgi:hypothetical protein
MQDNLTNNLPNSLPPQQYDRNNSNQSYLQGLPQSQNSNSNLPQLSQQINPNQIQTSQFPPSQPQTQQYQTVNPLSAVLPNAISNPINSLSGNKNSPNQQNEISDQNNVDQLRKQSQ